MSRSTTRLFKRSDDNLPTSPQSALFGRQCRSQAEGGDCAEVKPWARFTAKVTATFTSLTPAPPREQPRRAQTPTAEMMIPRRQPLQTVEVEVEPRSQPFVHPYNHPFLNESTSPPSASSHRNSLMPPPRPSSRRMSIQSTASDFTHVTIPDTPITMHAPSFQRSTSPPRKFPTPLPTPPQSANHTTTFFAKRKHTTTHHTEPIHRSWSGHPFAVRPPGDTLESVDNTNDFYNPDVDTLFSVDEQPHGLAATLCQRQPTPEPSPFNTPVDHNLTGSSKSRPRRGTFGSGDAPSLNDELSEDEFKDRPGKGYDDPYGRDYEEYGRWRYALEGEDRGLIG